jgi:hypothetical protein
MSSAKLRAPPCSPHSCTATELSRSVPHRLCRWEAGVFYTSGHKHRHHCLTVVQSLQSISIFTKHAMAIVVSYWTFLCLQFDLYRLVSPKHRAPPLSSRHGWCGSSSGAPAVVLEVKVVLRGRVGYVGVVRLAEASPPASWRPTGHHLGHWPR